VVLPTHPLSFDDLKAPLARHRHVSTRTLTGGGALLFHADMDEEKAVNRAGLLIWAALNGDRTPEDLAGDLSRAFEGTPLSEVRRDVDDFLSDLRRSGFAVHGQDREAACESVKGFPEDLSAPRELDLSLTGHCNLSCTYCFYAEEMRNRPDADTEEWLAFFSEMRSLGIRHVTLSGGEVFCREDLWDLMDAAVESRLRCAILTNGTLVTEKVLARLEQGRRRTRLDSVQVSVDGSRPEIHDRSRGRGSFSKAVRGLRLLMEAGFPVTVRVTVNRHNVDDLEDLARFLLEEMGVSSISTNDAMPIGAGGEHRDRIGLNPSDLIQAMTTLARLDARYAGRVTATAGPLAKWRMYRDMELARKTGEAVGSWGMGFLSACSGVFDKLAVHPDGAFSPCNMLSPLILGRMDRDAILNIWTAHPTLRSLRERRRIPMSKVPGCEDCAWAPYCNGSCPGPALALTGDANRANPHDCYRVFLRRTGISSICDLETDGNAHVPEAPGR